MANIETEEPQGATTTGGVTAEVLTGHQQVAEPDAEDVYLKGWALASLTLASMAVSFVLALYNTVLATAIPQITSDFQSLNDMGWYGSSYLIAQMALLPSCGRLYTLYNVRWTYCSLLVIFELGCIISAVAPSSTVLIVGRAVSGLGAAGLLSGSTILMSFYVALQKRPIFLAEVLGVYSVGSAVGPLVGGAITDNKSLTWRFIFWMNLPFGAVVLVLIWIALRTPPPASKAGLPWAKKIRQLDIPGASLLLGAIVCLNLALQWGGIVYEWSNAKVFGCMIGFGLLLIVFLCWQARQNLENALIPLHIFRSRTVCVSCGFMLLVQVAMVLQTYYWPIYFQSVLNTSARDSGIYSLPLIISNSLATLAAGWLTSKTGRYVPLMWIGAPILATGGGLFQLLGRKSAAGQRIGFQILSGIGYGLCGQMAITAVQVVLDEADVATAIVVVLLFQVFGGALGPSVGQNIFTDKLVRNLAHVEGIDAAAIVAAGGKEFRKLVAADKMDEVVDAFASALRNVFWVALATPALAWIVSWAMEWRRIPKARAKAVPGAHPTVQDGVDSTQDTEK